MIKEELKELKKVRKSWKTQDEHCESMHHKIGKTFGISPEKFGTWHITDFEKVWKEMDEIEPLTPVTQSKRKD